MSGASDSLAGGSLMSGSLTGGSFAGGSLVDGSAVGGSLMGGSLTGGSLTGGSLGEDGGAAGTGRRWEVVDLELAMPGSGMSDCSLAGSERSGPSGTGVGVTTMVDAVVTRGLCVGGASVIGVIAGRATVIAGKVTPRAALRAPWTASILRGGDCLPAVARAIRWPSSSLPSSA